MTGPSAELYDRLIYRDAMRVVMGRRGKHLGDKQTETLIAMHQGRNYRRSISGDAARILVSLEARGLVEKAKPIELSARMQKWILTDLGARVAFILLSGSNNAT
jgi:hypothetical protein